MFPPERDPPIITNPLTMTASSASEVSAVAMLVSGPIVNQRYFSGIFANHVANKFRGRLADRLGLRFRKDSAAQTILAVSIGGGYEPAHQGRSGARSHRDLSPTRDFDHAQSIGKGQLQRHVAGDRRDGLNLQLRRAHGKQQCQRIVHSRVGVDNDARWTVAAALGWRRATGCLRHERWARKAGQNQSAGCGRNKLTSRPATGLLDIHGFAFHTTIERQLPIAGTKY